MKKCISCDINVVGKSETCPLCQNRLTGVETPFNWPAMAKLKKQAFLYKLQLFLVLASSAVGIVLDFLLKLNNGKHWSVIVAISAITIEMVVKGFLKRSPIVPKIINISMLHIALLLLLCSWYFGFLHSIVFVVLPILMGATMVANFVFSLIDKTENAMVYLLTNIFAGIVSYSVISIVKQDVDLIWTISFMIGVVTLIGIIVFKGPKVFSEVKKRMNF